VYDITKNRSFLNVENWMTELKSKGPPGMAILLVGNKSDLAEEQRGVEISDATEYSQKNNVAFIETSALDSTNVDKAFNLIVSCKCLFLF
jgi:Ras-related protein Rab-11A